MFSVSVLEQRYISLFIRVLSLSATFVDFYRCRTCLRVWFIALSDVFLEVECFSCLFWNVIISPFIKVLSCFQAVVDVELFIAVNYKLKILFNAVTTKSYIICKVHVHFYRHRDIISLSFSRPTFYHVSATSHFQSAGSRKPVGLCPMPWRQVLPLLSHSSDSVLPASYMVRDPEQIAASEALLVLHEGPRAS